MRTLTIRIEDGPAHAERKYPLEPFQTMPPQVAADGFQQTIRKLLAELEQPSSQKQVASSTIPAGPAGPVLEPSPAPAKKPKGWYMKEKAARMKAEKEQSAVDKPA